MKLAPSSPFFPKPRPHSVLLYLHRAGWASPSRVLKLGPSQPNYQHHTPIVDLSFGPLTSRKWFFCPYKGALPKQSATRMQENWNYNLVVRVGNIDNRLVSRGWHPSLAQKGQTPKPVSRSVRSPSTTQRPFFCQNPQTRSLNISAKPGSAAPYYRAHVALVIPNSPQQLWRV